MLVYLAECKHCSKQYVGRTVIQLRCRIRGHRGWVNKQKPKKEKKNPDDDDDDEAALVEHMRDAHGLSSSDDFDATYLFTVLQICRPDTIVSNEYKWISEMKTLAPFGLNLAKPFGLSELLI